MFPSLVENFIAPPSPSWVNPTLVPESLAALEVTRDFPRVIAENECDRWSIPSPKAGSDHEGEETKVLEHRELCRSLISVAPLPVPLEPMSGTRDYPTLV